MLAQDLQHQELDVTVKVDAALARFQLLDRQGPREWLAWDPLLGRRVLLLAGPRARVDLEAARRASGLVHPNLQVVLDAGETEALGWVAAEASPGVPLSEWLAARRRPTAAVFALFSDYARGLEAAHGRRLGFGEAVDADELWVCDDGRGQLRGLSLLSSGASEPGQDYQRLCRLLERAVRGRALPERVRRLFQTPASSGRELLAALAPLRHRHVGWAAALALTAGAAAAGVLLHGQGLRRSCHAAGERVEAVWGANQRARVSSAWSPASADVEASTVAKELDRYASRWREAHAGLCEAAHHQKTLAGPALDASMACLTRRLYDLDALVDALGTVDVEGRRLSVPAVFALAGPEQCAVSQAQAGRTSGASEAAREPVARALARSRALMELGRYADAVEASTKAEELAHAAALTDFELESRLLRGEALGRSGDGPGAERALRGVLLELEPGWRSSLAGEAWVQLMVNVGIRQERGDEALAMDELAKAAIEAGGADVQLEARRLSLGAAVLQRKARYRDAKARHEAALELLQRLPGGALPAVATTRANLASTLAELGAYEEADAQARMSQEVLERLLGPEHPRTLGVRAVRATNRVRQGNYAGLADELRQVVAARARVLGPEHPETLAARNVLGTVYLLTGQSDAAVTELEEVLALRQHSQGKASPPALEAHNNLGRALLSADRLDEAETHLLAAYRGREATLGKSHRFTVSSLCNLALLRLGQRRGAEALELADQCLSYRTQQLPAGHPDLAMGLCTRGRALRLLGKEREAVEVLEKSRELLVASERGGADLEVVERALAQAKARMGGASRRGARPR